MDGSNDATKSDHEDKGILAKIIGTAAPVMAAALTGNAAGVVVALLEHAFGMAPGAVSGLVDKIAGDPEASYRLRALELQHAQFIADLDSKNLATESADRQDARKYSPSYRGFLIQMAFIVTAGFFGVLALLFVPMDISDEGKNLLSMLVGMLASKWQTIIDFFFGSSHSQDVKVKL